ncbi:hypothetical protein KA082_01330 [Candidatus Woesebacteria bacterium]|nr:hypothetical protein [Candidatus Woesebacteria bacterium]
MNEGSTVVDPAENIGGKRIEEMDLLELRSKLEEIRGLLQQVEGNTKPIGNDAGQRIARGTFLQDLLRKIEAEISLRRKG